MKSKRSYRVHKSPETITNNPLHALQPIPWKPIKIFLLIYV
jgi:hypothetical protein